MGLFQHTQKAVPLFLAQNQNQNQNRNNYIYWKSIVFVKFKQNYWRKKRKKELLDDPRLPLIVFIGEKSKQKPEKIWVMNTNKLNPIHFNNPTWKFVVIFWNHLCQNPKPRRKKGVWMVGKWKDGSFFEIMNWKWRKNKRWNGIIIWIWRICALALLQPFVKFSRENLIWFDLIWFS